MQMMDDAWDMFINLRFIIVVEVAARTQSAGHETAEQPTSD